MTTETYKVRGMTCDHCVASVKGEIVKLPGVRDVEVDLATGDVVVSSDDALEVEVVREAVDEAGYELAS